MAEKMKQCKACGQTIAKSAKVCPSCGAKQKGKGKIIIAAVVALIAIIAVAGGSGGGSSSKIDNSGRKDSTESTSNASASKNESTAEKVEEPEDEFVVVGGSFEKNGLKFTVDDADLEYELKGNSYGFYDLDEGLHYIAVNFTFENTGSSDKYVSIYDFDCYADNAACEQQYVTADTGDFINTNLSAGRKVSFTTLYAVPDGAESVELEYTTNVWSDEKVLIKLK